MLVGQLQRTLLTQTVQFLRSSRMASHAASQAADDITSFPDASSLEPLWEVKRKLDGAEKCFKLELWLHEPDTSVVGRWVAPAGNPWLQAGSYSWGVWVLGANWGAYR